MLDVVIVVGVPGVSHQRLEDIGERSIEPGVILGEYAVIMYVIVKQECESTAVPCRHYPVTDAVEPGEAVIE